MEDEVLDSLLEMVDGFEGNIARFKQRIAQLKGVMPKSIYDVSKLNWQKRQGAKGEWEIAEKQLHIGNSDFQYLVDDMKRHKNNTITKDGFFYWLLDDGSVGRKKSRF